ncbi:cytochrome P450 [Nocardia brasiliensis]|uniref:cytochrome P450 n=1 Tax=Nocardia brasiliensis TaxID=37326 RepID=UPI001893FCB5|nr:cytochrome P450 [Nocardia brasiliensis]MBF6548815.1 cytochrome P450 [Nocardia brasiliensis]
MTDLFGAGFAAYPWATLARLRDTGGVHRITTPDGPPAWLVTRYADVRAGLLDERLAMNVRHAGAGEYRGFTLPRPLDTYQHAEPADHARLRRIVTGELSPRRLAQWTELAPELVDSFLRELDPGAEIDLVAQLAVPLPAAVLGELLGLGESERAAMLGWADATLLPSDTPPRARDTLSTMVAIIEATIARARAEPGDSLLGRLVAAHTTTGALSTEELGGLLFYLLFVWYEVLVDLVTGATLALLEFPDQARLLRETREKHSAVDELLRYLSPQVLAAPRYATTELTIGAQTIRAGQTVLLCLASANRDPETFGSPDELNLTRAPHAQLALGYGAHACLGNALVRTLGGATLDQLFTRWPDTTLTADARDIPWRSGFRHRGPLTLPVRLG